MSTPTVPSALAGVMIPASCTSWRPESSWISIAALRTPRVTSSNGASTVVGASPRNVCR